MPRHRCGTASVAPRACSGSSTRRHRAGSTTCGADVARRSTWQDPDLEREVAAASTASRTDDAIRRARSDGSHGALGRAELQRDLPPRARRPWVDRASYYSRSTLARRRQQARRWQPAGALAQEHRARAAIDEAARTGAGADRERARDRAHDRRADRAAERDRQQQAEQQAAGQDRDRRREDQLRGAPGDASSSPVALAAVAALAGRERVRLAARVCCSGRSASRGGRAVAQCGAMLNSACIASRASTRSSRASTEPVRQLPDEIGGQRSQSQTSGVAGDPGVEPAIALDARAAAIP